jgi:translocation and assembly module TamA
VRPSPRLLLLATAAALALACALAASANTPVRIEGVGKDVREEIEKILPDREAPQSLFDAERLAEEAAQRTTQWLRAEGWYGATVTPEANDEPLLARVTVEAGPRFVFAAPELTYTGDAPDEGSARHVADATALVRAGAPARAADVLAAEAAAVAALRESGYAEAQAATRRVIVDHATNTVTTTFVIVAGPRVRLGDVRVEPPDALRPGFVRSLPSWDRGEPFKPELLAVLRRDLASTGAFSIVSTKIADEPASDGARDVIVTLERAKRRVLEVGAGYSTTEGLGVEAEWTLRNYSRRADALVIKGTLAEQTQSLSAELTRPNAAGPGRAVRFSTGIAHDNSGPFERSGVYISGAVDAARRLRFAMTYGVTASADLYNEAQGVENAIALTGFADARRDETDSPLDARRGYLVQARLEPTVSTGDATVAFVRSTAQARYYATRRESRYTLATRLRLGWIEPIGGDTRDVPLDRLFYAGGGGSVRGYDFNSIFPVTNTRLAQPPGGRGLVETSGEVRARVTDRIGAALFVDGGNAFNDTGEALDLRWGVGAGVRYDLGFAPLRVDVATPLDSRPGDPEVAIYVSIGQAF